jgi:hypothetical protein
MSNLAFIVCTEPGRLEGQSLLLAESIRKYCGSLKGTPMYSFHPRIGEPISIHTQKAFESLEVIHQQIPINIDHHNYYLANKPLVCAYAEKNIDADILVFIDSDKCFFSEPKELLLPEECNVRVRPEYGQGIGSLGKGDPQEWYWQKLYEVFGVKREIFVNTPIGNKKIRSYWNSGLIAVRRDAGIFSAWKENFEKIMRLNITPPQGIYYLEQSVLSATISAREDKISEFSSNYSYPLPLHNRLSNPYKINCFDEMVSIHYFNMFYYYDWKKQLEGIKAINKKSEKSQWLYEGITRHNMPFRPPLHRHIVTVKRIENKLNRLKLNIHFSSWIERFI